MLINGLLVINILQMPHLKDLHTSRAQLTLLNGYPGRPLQAALQMSIPGVFHTLLSGPVLD